jgi:hypothetical protein
MSVVTISFALPMGEVLNRTPTESIPFNATKQTAFLDRNYGIDYNSAIPDKMYDNVQCTQYTRAAEDPYMGGCLFRKFAISGSSNKLVAVSFGGASPYRTDVLCVVTPSGTIVSTLEAHITAAEATIKQFRINAQGQIIISQIVPTTSASIPFTTFTSFTGQRKDITYSVNAQGQFVMVDTKQYNAKTYTRAILENENINIWDGGEVLPASQLTKPLPSKEKNQNVLPID